jgi:hypothetical protein
LQGCILQRLWPPQRRHEPVWICTLPSAAILQLNPAAVDLIPESTPNPAAGRKLMAIDGWLRSCAPSPPEVAVAVLN